MILIACDVCSVTVNLHFEVKLSEVLQVYFALYLFTYNILYVKYSKYMQVYTVDIKNMLFQIICKNVCALSFYSWNYNVKSALESIMSIRNILK